MNRRRLSAFIDALVEGRRPEGFRADSEDAGVVRTAIGLRAARPGDSKPDEQFVSALYESLANEQPAEVVPIDRPVKLRRGRAVLAAVAASVVLVGGTAVATEAFSQVGTPAAIQAPQGKVLRTGTFETTDNRVMGQIVVYRGNPSWVFMNVDGSTYSGPITCKLQVENGSTVAVGVFHLHGGMGQFSRTIQVDTGSLRGAKLVSSSGSVVASATLV
jgi:hypothetical protein